MTPLDHAVIDGVDVDAVAAVVANCATVARLSGGLLGEAATYLPGRRVPGVVVRSAAGGRVELQVRVVGRYGPTMAEIAAEVSTAARWVATRAARVEVVIDDLDDSGDTEPRQGQPEIAN